jgi:hypothetical protein
MVLWSREGGVVFTGRSTNSSSASMGLDASFEIDDGIWI